MSSDNCQIHWAKRHSLFTGLILLDCSPHLALQTTPSFLKPSLPETSLPTAVQFSSACKYLLPSQQRASQCCRHWGTIKRMNNWPRTSRNFLLVPRRRPTRKHGLAVCRGSSMRAVHTGGTHQGLQPSPWGEGPNVLDAFCPGFIRISNPFPGIPSPLSFKCWFYFRVSPQFCPPYQCTLLKAISSTPRISTTVSILKTLKPLFLARVMSWVLDSCIQILYQLALLLLHNRKDLKRLKDLKI